MNAQQAENLRILIRYMDATKVESLRMHTVTFCGTPACAMGHARMVGELCERGMPPDGLSAAAVSFFGMADCLLSESPLGWARLFGASLAVRNDLGRFNYVDRPTPQQWAAEARKVLAENGYSMGAAAPQTDDGFAAFMHKVREPVALTA